MKEFDTFKTSFEKNNKEYIVSTIINLNSKYVVVSCKRRDGKKPIPGNSFKVDKKTGEIVGLYSPMENLEEYIEAMEKRSKKYD